MNLSVKPGTVGAKTRLDHLCDLHCNVLTIKTGNEQKGNLCRGFKRGPLHWCFWKRASKIAFICSCSRELEEICFRGRVWSSTLAENHPIATLLETTKFYPKSFCQVLVVTDVNLLSLTQMRVSPDMWMKVTNSFYLTTLQPASPFHLCFAPWLHFTFTNKAPSIKTLMKMFENFCTTLY